MLFSVTSKKLSSPWVPKQLRWWARGFPTCVSVWRKGHGIHVVGFLFLCTDGDVVLLKCGRLAFLDPSHGFDRRTIQSMEFMLAGNWPVKVFSCFFDRNVWFIIFIQKREAHMVPNVRLSFLMIKQHPYVYLVLVFEAMATFVGQVSVLSLIALFGAATTAMVHSSHNHFLVLIITLIWKKVAHFDAHLMELEYFYGVLYDFEDWILSQVTTARKAVTLLLSYLIFTKPLTDQHGTGLLLIAMGITVKLLPDKNPYKRSSTSSAKKAKIEKPSANDEEERVFQLGTEDVEDEEKRRLV